MSFLHWSDSTCSPTSTSPNSTRHQPFSIVTAVTPKHMPPMQAGLPLTKKILWLGSKAS